ncbi:M48 family metallopeptidase [Actinoplanes sp. N902-109]|uniref:M48 family metallopeptidase n=1 Tax=Actinoplanes sp. (strain N902-109) TaxID=649831 RepID=UPI0003296868|nr:M48 family metallopeptidase [Actinoplanes sp. N902-109]AGL18280.1 peptidase M48, Ste24p [Actinoplanes sp. N902-109]
MLTATTSCPQCQDTLVSVGDADPWCGACEWNLDSFPHARGGWFARRMVRLDRRAGFRADRKLAGRDEEAVGRRLTVRHLALVAVSAVLVLIVLALAVTGGWLVVTGGILPPIVLGLLMIALAWVLRPRLGRRSRVAEGGWEVDPGSAPAVWALVTRIADATGAPRPDVIVIDTDWNAATAVIGLRRTRVLWLGVPLLLTLDEQEQVALIGHELGHLANEDSLRRLLEQPARTVFGRLGRLVAPAPENAVDMGLAGPVALGWTILQVLGGLASFVLFSAHLGMHLLGAAEQRRAEIRADLMSARAAGSRAALRAIDVLAMLPRLDDLLFPNVLEGEAAVRWHKVLTDRRGTLTGDAAVLRQFSIRADASLFADHPAPGRRHQWLSARPYLDPAVVVTPAEGERLRAEIAPYAEPIARRLRERHGL